ncbi:hypothetical protein D9M70_363440 [compost metagenome]
MQTPHLSATQAQHFGQHRLRVGTQTRRRLCGKTLLIETERNGRTEYRADARLIDLPEHWIGLRASRILVQKLAHALVATPTHAAAVECFAQLCQGTCRHPGIDQRREFLTGPEALPLKTQVDTKTCFQRTHLLNNAGDLTQAAPLLESQTNHHDALTVTGHKIAAEGSEQIVAITLALLPTLRLCQKAQMRHHRQCDIFQRQLDVLTNAVSPPVPLGGQQAERSHLAGDQIPGG